MAAPFLHTLLLLFLLPTVPFSQWFEEEVQVEDREESYEVTFNPARGLRISLRKGTLGTGDRSQGLRIRSMGNSYYIIQDKPGKKKKKEKAPARKKPSTKKKPARKPSRGK